MVTLFDAQIYGKIPGGTQDDCLVLIKYNTQKKFNTPPNLILEKVYRNWVIILRSSAAMVIYESNLKLLFEKCYPNKEEF